MLIGKTRRVWNSAKMTAYSDDHLAQFRAQSDRAFREMQEKADREMSAFLAQYGSDRPVSLGSVTQQEPQLQQRLQRSEAAAPPSGPALQAPAPQQAPALQQTPAPQQSPTPQSAPTTQNPNLSPPEDSPESLFELPGMDIGAISKESILDSVDDVRSDLNQLSDELRRESKNLARDTMRGTSDILRGKSFQLGKKAKEEAAALAEAARKAMQEERNLKAMKGRAAEEARKAKERLQREAEQAKGEVIDDLKELARGKIDFLKGKAADAFQTGRESLEREFDDLTTGQDS